MAGKSEIISDADRITRFLNRLRLESRKVVLRSDLIETGGMITDVDYTTIEIVVQGNFQPPNNIINLQFAIDGDTYFGFVDLLRITGRNLVLAKPQELERRMARKYPRTFVNGEVFARFHIISDVSNEREIGMVSAPPRLSAIYYELQKQVPDIKKVLSMVGSEVNNITRYSEIRLHKEGEKYPEEVNLVVKYRKAFWIQETGELKNFIKTFPAGEMINFGGFLSEMRSAGWQDSKIREEILRRKARYEKQQVHSLTVVPVKLFDNVIGHISLITKTDSPRVLRLSDVYYAKALADIVSEALAKARLFRLDTGDDFNIPVYNLSAGGAYLEVNSQYIIKFLQEGMHLKLSLKLPGKQIDTIAEIRRIDFLTDQVRLALHFEEINGADQDYVENYVRRLIEIGKGNA